VYPIDQEFNAVGAVYVVSRQYKNSSDARYTHDPIYAGQTDNLSTRFDSHHKADCFKDHEANCICVHVDDDEESRLSKEDDLNKGLQPPCND
jgi:predicted GIY-YIG superfamily endonuclease